eukprot:355543-Chlamydomonas_euryale.AAC.1
MKSTVAKPASPLALLPTQGTEAPRCSHLDALLRAPAAAVGGARSGSLPSSFTIASAVRSHSRLVPQKSSTLWPFVTVSRVSHATSSRSAARHASSTPASDRATAPSAVRSSPASATHT